MTRLRPKNWWQAGLLWGTLMFVYFVVTQAIDGELTLTRAGKDLLVCLVGGLIFGILLTAVLSLVARKNLFRGFPNRKGNR